MDDVKKIYVSKHLVSPWYRPAPCALDRVEAAETVPVRVFLVGITMYRSAIPRDFPHAQEDLTTHALLSSIVQVETDCPSSYGLLDADLPSKWSAGH